MQKHYHRQINSFRGRSGAGGRCWGYLFIQVGLIIRFLNIKWKRKSLALLKKYHEWTVRLSETILDGNLTIFLLRKKRAPKPIQRIEYPSNRFWVLTDFVMVAQNPNSVLYLKRLWVNGKLTGLRSIVVDKKSWCLRTKVRLLWPTFLWDHQVGTFLYHIEASMSRPSCSWGVKSTLLTPKSSRIVVSTASLNSGEQTKITFFSFNRSKSINLVGKLFDFNRS